MFAVYVWLFEFFLTWPGMAVIVIVCIGNGILCRGRLAFSNAFWFMILAVTFLPIAILWIGWSSAVNDLPKDRTDPLTSAIIWAIILFLLIWVPVAIRCFIDGRRPVETADKPTGGFPVIGKEERG